MTEQTVPDHAAKLDEIARRWLDDGRKVRPSELPEQVYHYTDAGGLLNMLGGGKLWLTDFRFLNDRTEFTHTHELIDELLTRRAAGCESVEAMLIDGVRKRRGMEDLQNAYVFSLSEQRDDLSQWRGYARDGLGFTLGFDAAKLCAFAEITRTCVFSRVEYDRRRQLAGLERAYDELLAYARAHRLEDKLVDAAASNFEWLATSRGALNKHASFRSEAEWRLYTYCLKTDPDGDVKVRASGLNLVPYVEIAPIDAGKLPLKSIGIGPGFTDPAIKDAVSAAARQRGYGGIDIYSADTPYRRNG